jgi:uncharacterized coiled-coil protein SlyX
MSQQYNKVEKKRRRLRYLKRLKKRQKQAVAKPDKGVSAS